MNGLVNHAKTGLSGEVLHVTYAGVSRQIKLRMIEQVEELSSKIDPHILIRQQEMFDQRKICIHETRPVQRRSVRSPKLPSGCPYKGTRIKPVLDCVHLGWCRASRVRRHRSRLVGVTNLVRAVVAKAIPLKGCS